MGQWDHSMCWYYHAPCQETHICYHANTHMSGLNTFSSAVLKLHIKGAAQRRSGPVRPSDCDDGSSFTVLSHVLAAVGHLWNTSGARRGLKKYYYDHTVCKDGCFSKMISLMSGHRCFIVLGGSTCVQNGSCIETFKLKFKLLCESDHSCCPEWSGVCHWI